MILFWQFGQLAIAALFMMWTWGRVASFNLSPLHTRNVVLTNAVGLIGVFGALTYLTMLRVIDTIGGSDFGSVVAPGSFTIGMSALNCFAALLVWTGSLRREDFARLDSPTTIARSWWLFVALTCVWGMACAAWRSVH